MRVRKRYLPPGWYPGSAEATRAAISDLAAAPAGESPTLAGAPDAVAGASIAVAGVAPHAGWEFSGRLALEVLSAFPRTLDTIVIIGGHLGPADGILCAFEDAYETPLGPVTADLELLRSVQESVSVREDRHADNTVEIHLPFVRHLFPGACALGFRAAPSRDAAALGEALASAAARMGRSICVLGSTDLTHYGSSYGFQPAGSGEKALRWVREINDRRFIDSILGFDMEAAVDRAMVERSACSAGGAIAAMSYARARGAASASLIGYMTSFDVHPAESFVGYAGILFRKGA